LYSCSHDSNEGANKSGLNNGGAGIPEMDVLGVDVGDGKGSIHVPDFIRSDPTEVSETVLLRVMNLALLSNATTSFSSPRVPVKVVESSISSCETAVSQLGSISSTPSAHQLSIEEVTCETDLSMDPSLALILLPPALSSD